MIKVQKAVLAAAGVSCVGILSVLSVNLCSAQEPKVTAKEQTVKTTTETTKSPVKLKTYHGDVHVEKVDTEKGFVPEPDSDKAKEGRKLYDNFKCAQCHQIDHQGGYAGPSLDGVGAGGRVYVNAHINNPQAEALKKDNFFELLPTSMPDYTISKDQAQKITDYLMTLPTLKDR